MIKKIKRELHKDRYIRVITFKNDKSIKVNYYHENEFKPKFLINNDHFFLQSGYRTILTSDTVNESINPLDIHSLYPVEKFQSAIESKVIKDIFNDLKTEKLDLMKVLLMANLGIGLALLYFQVM